MKTALDHHWCRQSAAVVCRWGRKSCLGFIFLLCGLWPLTAAATTAAGQGTGDPPEPLHETGLVSTASGAEQAQEHWEIQSVRELMQQDLREALRAPAAGAESAAAQSIASVRAVLAPRLVALYGVGRTLMAEVQVGRQAYLYVRGQAYPAGHLGDQGVYQLRGMNGACVQLERAQDRHSLCLRMLLGEAQP